ncbi:MAG TPA: hypothetical protein VI076_16580 [Actinopolymorphaceae bacterium]
MTDWICEPRSGVGDVTIPRPFVRFAVAKAWQWVESAVVGASIPDAIAPAIRALALAICKAPERHEAVARYCMDRLTTKIARAVQRDLVEAVGENWLPQTARALDGAHEDGDGGEGEAAMSETSTPSPGLPSQPLASDAPDDVAPEESRT